MLNFDLKDISFRSSLKNDVSIKIFNDSVHNLKTILSEKALFLFFYRDVANSLDGDLSSDDDLYDVLHQVHTVTFDWKAMDSTDAQATPRSGTIHLNFRLFCSN